MTELPNDRSLEESFKRNGSMLLHYRNIYVFLAAIAEDAMSNNQLASSEVVGYLLVRKLLELIGWLGNIMSGKEVLPDTTNWQQFTKERDFIDIKQYIAKEHEVFKAFHKSIYGKLIAKVDRFPPEIREAV